MISFAPLHKTSGGILSLETREKVNCSRIVTLGEDGLVRFVTTMKPAELARLSGHGGPVRHIAFSPNNANILASASDDGTVKVWDWTREKQQREMAEEQVHSGSIVSTVVSQDGSIFASISKGGDIKFWHTNTASGNVTTVHIEDDSSPVCGVFCPVHPGLSRLFVDCDDGSLHCIDVPDSWACSSEKSEPEVVLKEHIVGKFVSSVRSMAYNPASRSLIICKYPDRFIVFCPETLASIDEISCDELNPIGIAFSRNNTYVGFSSFVKVNTSFFVDIPGANVSCIVAPTLPRPQFDFLACLWDGSIIASKDNGSVIPVFKPLKSTPILCAAFAPNERHLIVGRRDGTVSIIDTKPWIEVATFVCNSPVTSVAVSCKSQLIIAGDALGRIYLLKYFRR